MSATDRNFFLRILKKHKRKKKGRAGVHLSKAATDSNSHSSNNSISSVNHDWENWAHLHGKADVVAADVQSLGRGGELREATAGAKACGKVWVRGWMWESVEGGTSTEASCGLVTVWNASRIAVFSSMSYDHVLVIKGKVISSGEEFVVCNVYAPCDLVAKKELWERLHLLAINYIDLCLCVCGDFNSVQSIDERKGRGTVFRQGDAELFNKFIQDNFLIDLPICGRLFTWYYGDVVSMSRLDRFLLSNKWCEKWPSCIQVAYQRGLSDHVPVLLYVDDANWGPHLLQMLKCWFDYTSYEDFVRAKWGTFSMVVCLVEGVIMLLMWCMSMVLEWKRCIIFARLSIIIFQHTLRQLLQCGLE
ncbi:endonuclease/exonuclease/phosphatase family protein [Medicago truncatula]|uniref:Endonuclease/exonuclease/phosphatase family protein n=1 Tax=Medicago truncatula TaxID=3880 RepID=G7IDH2_MEDTR|nr:endonuclease/exonuclease/phosphatase family protein [Medicago truncatula]